MAIIWFFMILLSVVCLIFTNPSVVTSSLLEASASSVELCMNLCGIYAVWLGLINILDKSGISEKIANLLSPVIKFLFKTKNPEATKYIAINMSSNILGLGNAATPSGIKAMNALDDGTGKITFAGIMLIVVNSCSIQLLPTTVIGLRENAGSVASGDIILPSILASLLTFIFAVSITLLINTLTKKIRRAKP